MARRVAWLLDIGFGTLQASARSAARMAECLVAHRFETHTLSGSEVTRARVHGLLCAMREELQPGDAFVLYFVGHGDKIWGASSSAPSGPPDDELLVLITHDVFGDGEALPVIAGPELSAWLSPLADKIGNVTVILDCCRAATLVPGEAPDEGSAAKIEVILHQAAAALRAKYRGGSDTTRGGPSHASHASIVRLVATTRNQYAIERRQPDGWIGLFTDCLAGVLMRPRDRELSWDELLPELQDLVLAGCPTQRPGVEGPRHRVPFSLRERRDPDEHPCYLAGDGWIVDAGMLHGIETGDRFDLGAKGATAERVEPHRTFLRTIAGSGGPEPQRTRRIAGARVDIVAWCSEQSPPTDPPGLRLHRGLHAAAIATVEDRATGTVLCDTSGNVIHAGIEGLLAAACRQARWSRQAPAFAALASDHLLNVEWGREGSTVALPRTGVELPADAELWVRASGTGEHSEVFVSLFRLRADRHLVHGSADLDHGVSVPRNGSVDLLPGSGVREPRWGPQVATDQRSHESLILVVSTQPRSFHRIGTTPAVEPEAIGTRVRQSAVHRDPARTDLAVVTLSYYLYGR